MKNSTNTRINSTISMTLLTINIFCSQQQQIAHGRTKNARNYFIAQMKSLNEKEWIEVTRIEYTTKAGSISPEPEKRHPLVNFKQIDSDNEQH